MPGPADGGERAATLVTSAGPPGARWPGRPPPGGGASLALFLGVVLVALNLRPAVASIPPILGDLGLGAVGGAALTTLPVVCFGAVAPIAPALRRRVGEERALWGVLVVLLGGLVVRAWWPLAGLFVGTALAGAAVAVMNVLLPSLVKRRFPHHRVGIMTGVYTMSLSLGAAIAAGITVPIYEGTGRSVTAALGLWGIPAIVALAAWAPQMGRRSGAAAGPRRSVRLWDKRLAWQVTAFMGTQSLVYYAVLSWLPAIYQSHGLSPARAGLMLSINNLAGIPTALVAPFVASRSRDQRAAVAVATGLCAIGLLGLLLLPTTVTAVWPAVLGLGQGAAIGLALLFLVLRASDGDASASLSSMAQTVGYLLAAGGPLAVGLLHGAVGGWGTPLILLLVLTALEAAVGLAAARRRTVP
ncbi:MAG: CynX/NimT family MFS transporter [Acidimicrobiales bacterium]